GTHTYGVAMATVVNEQLDDIKLEAMPTSGQIENMRLLQSGEVQIGLAGSDTGYDLYHGIRRYEGQAWKDLRLVWPLFSSFQHIIVLERSPFQSIEDLRGKHLGISNPGSAGYYFSVDYLRSQGLNEGDYIE